MPKYPYKLDPKKRALAARYSRMRIAGYIANNLIVTIIFLYAFIASGFHAFLYDSLGLSGIPAMIAYAFVFLTLLFIAQLPLRFCLTYSYEHKYKLSNYSIGGWLRDYLKRALIAYLFMLPVITALYLLTPLRDWWVYAGIAYLIGNAFSNLIYPVIITPFFYKLSPYKNKMHQKRIISMLRDAGVNGIEGVYVADESSKSKKPNAMFAGFGGTKRIILFDNLLNAFTKDEVETVIAHEVAHYVNKDISRFILLETAKAFAILFIIDKLMSLYGISLLSVQSLPFVLLIYTVLDFLAMPFINSYSRHREYHADLFALRTAKKKKAQISTEKRLADMALSHVPHPIIEFWFYSHPNFEKRVKMCESA
jgi:STE24 endopeptidase